MVRRTRVMFHIGTQMHNHEPDAEVPVDFSAITDRIYKDAGFSEGAATPNYSSHGMQLPSIPVQLSRYVDS